jgi:hypothetical protein
MSQKFSQKLVEDFRIYWRQRWGEKIPVETAETCLDALAELYLCVRKIDEGKRSR